MNMGHATLEIFDETQAQMLDQIEAGQGISGKIRFALKVSGLEATIVEKWKLNNELARLASSPGEASHTGMISSGGE